MSLATTQAHRESLQRQTQADWVNREYIELITGSIKRIADFLNSFDMSCRFAFVFFLQVTIQLNNSTQVPAERPQREADPAGEEGGPPGGQGGHRRRPEQSVTLRYIVFCKLYNCN